ncbi:MAG TPA: hypothetical protein VF461_04335 [Gemmatimonadaceae bacterium]
MPRSEMKAIDLPSGDQANWPSYEELAACGELGALRSLGMTAF